MLHPDRYFSPVPAVRDVARELYASIASLPLLCPHGHVDPRLLALDAPFPDPATLIVIPDHYVVRMLGSTEDPRSRTRGRSGSGSAITFTCFAARPAAPG
jgi:glucuronate isomerase